MASALVTQVQQNPDDAVQLNTYSVYPQAYQQEQEEQKHEPEHKRGRLSRWWRSCVSCFSCLRCSPCCYSKDQAAVEEERRYSLSKRQRKWLLPDLNPKEKAKPCLVLDLDETLVHSSFKPVPNADFVLSIELEGEIHHVYVLKRPLVDQFLAAVAKKWEVVVFTASLAKYADPLLDILDPHGYVKHRLFRESCVQHYGNYVKDLSQLGRDIKHSVIIDNSPYSYMFQRDNALPCTSWFNDMSDVELMQMVPILDDLAACDDVTTVLSNLQHTYMQPPPDQNNNAPAYQQDDQY